MTPWGLFRADPRSFSLEELALAFQDSDNGDGYCWPSSGPSSSRLRDRSDAFRWVDASDPRLGELTILLSQDLDLHPRCEPRRWRWPLRWWPLAWRTQTVRHRGIFSLQPLQGDMKQPSKARARRPFAVSTASYWPPALDEECRGPLVGIFDCGLGRHSIPLSRQGFDNADFHPRWRGRPKFPRLIGPLFGVASAENLMEDRRNPLRARDRHLSFVIV